MRLERAEPWQVPSPLTIPSAASSSIHENTSGLVHWVRSILYGECPECHGTYVSEVYGWNKVTCSQCGHTWKTGF